MALHTITITLPQTFADKLRNKVASGEFDSESDVVVAGLIALEDEGTEQDLTEVDQWLREKVVPIALRMEESPEEGYSPEEVVAHLAEARRKREQRIDAA